MPSTVGNGAKTMKAKFIRYGLLLLLLGGITLAIVYRDQIDVASLQDWIHGAGAVGPIVFMLLYVVGTVFFFPGSIMTPVGGILFGPVLGTFYNLTGATVGATLAFLAARHLASDWVESKTGKRLQRLQTGVEAEGWRFVAFVRLVPLFPFNLLNYALGLTRIKLSHYLIATYIFMLPGAIAYTYIGYVGREAIAGSEGLIQKGMLGLALLAAVAFLPRLIGKLRKGKMVAVDELKQRIDSGEKLLVLDVRSEADFTGEQGHIAEAVNIPLEALPDRLEEIVSYQELPVITVCRTDKRSVKAVQLLLGNGFADTHVTRSGMTAWLKAGYSVEDKSPVEHKSDGTEGR